LRLKQIRDFVAVVESGGIRAAARKLGVSQPAITKSLRGLESELHARLLQRSSKGIVPTPSGRAFFARARVAQAELLKAQEEAAQASGGDAGFVALGVGPAAGFMIVPEAVARFREDFPKARIRVVEGFPHLLVPLVRDETLDFAIGPRPKAKLDPVFAFRPLFRHEYVVAARKGHPLRNARSLAQLATADWINFTPLGGLDGPLDRAFSSAGLPVPAQAIVCDSYHAALGMLMKSDMLLMISRWTLAGPIARDIAQEIPVAEPLPSSAVGMFTRADSPLTPLAAALARAVIVAARALTRSA